MPSMNGFAEGYSYYADSIGAVAAAQMGDLWVEEVNSAIDKLGNDLLEFSASAKTIDTLSGDLAEFWHADTYSIDAVLNGSPNRASIPRSTGFASPDIVLDSGEGFQIKYYQDGAHSAKAQAASFREAAHKSSTSRGAMEAIQGGADPNDPIYNGMGRIIPEGQVDDGIKELNRRIAKESAARREQVCRLEDTRDALVDKISDRDGIESKPLSREASKEIAREVREGKLDLKSRGISTDQLVELEHIMKSSLRTGMTAAAIAMAVKAAPVIASAIKDAAAEGRIDAEQILTGGADIMKTGAGAFLSGTIAAGLTESAKSGLLSSSLKAAPPEAIALAVILAWEGIQGGFKLAKGEISQAEFAESLFRKSYYALIAAGGGCLGQALIPAPAVGYALGSLAGSLIGGISYEVGSTVFIGLCVNKGMTFFGLVDQDYALPDHVLKHIGLEVFEYESFAPEKPELDIFMPEAPVLRAPSFDQFEVRYLRRGLIAFNRVGYI